MPSLSLIFFFRTSFSRHRKLVFKTFCADHSTIKRSLIILICLIDLLGKIKLKKSKIFDYQNAFFSHLEVKTIIILLLGCIFLGHIFSAGFPKFFCPISFSTKQWRENFYDISVYFSGDELKRIQAWSKCFCNLKTIYPRWKGPTQELYSSSRRTAVVPLFKNYIQFFWFFFWAGVMLFHPQATSTDHGGPRTSDFSIERRRRAPLHHRFLYHNLKACFGYKIFTRFSSKLTDFTDFFAICLNVE